jgi:DNA-binding IclR family transcriptional regulator
MIAAEDMKEVLDFLYRNDEATLEAIALCTGILPWRLEVCLQDMVEENWISREVNSLFIVVYKLLPAGELVLESLT